MVVGVLGQTASATFAAQAPPAITSLHPHLLHLSAAASTRTVTATGTRFGNGASELVSVRFGSASTPFAPCESFTWQGNATALCVLPLLVIIGWCGGYDLSLNFGGYEAATMLLSVISVTFAIKDGKSNWLLGLTLVAMYIVIAVGFWAHENDDLDSKAE